LFARALQDHVGTPGFYYELLYTLIIIIFGVRRVIRTPTPYIRLQTFSLAMFQLIPLFLLPYLILPVMGELGLFNFGVGGWIADQLFPMNEIGIREYWRAAGFILAWPLFIWNVFTPEPQILWLIIAVVQTFIVIPWIVYRYGKGAYCGWICSCGALAETLGDAHRAKMPHGSNWNKLNMAGQLILGVVFVLLLFRIVGWVFTGSALGEMSNHWFIQIAYGFSWFGVPVNYSIIVDYFLAGIIGMGLYFHFSGRTWCRFFCPLAALMHIYARFSQFRIFAEKSKCISCNACTSICHQGIDVMNFANKGLAMEDPQCVRCSACVQTCPTGVLSFGSIDKQGKITLDKLSASSVQSRENL
jgi:polyferredoxin